MARQFLATSEQGLGVLSAGASGAPISISAWFYPDTSHTGTIVSIYGGTSEDFYRLYAHSAGTLKVANRDDAGSNSPSATSTNTYTTSTWNHALGVFSGSTTVNVWLNAAGNASATLSNTITGLDETYIGVLKENAAKRSWFNGRIALVGIYGVALGATDAATLYNNGVGLHPLLYRRDDLIALYLLNRDGDIDPIGGATMTATNAPTFADNPPMFFPHDPHIHIASTGTPPPPTAAHKTSLHPMNPLKGVA